MENLFYFVLTCVRWMPTTHLLMSITHKLPRACTLQLISCISEAWYEIRFYIYIYIYDMKLRDFHKYQIPCVNAPRMQQQIILLISSLINEAQCYQIPLIKFP